MNTIPIQQLGPEQKNYLDSSISNPKFYIIIRGYDIDTIINQVRFQFEIGIQHGENIIMKTILKKYSDLQDFDNIIKKVFKEHKNLLPFPTKKLFGNLDKEFIEQQQKNFQQYFHQLIMIQGIFLFPPFLNLFQLDIEFFFIN